MHVLVVNCGSSSLKAAVIDPDSGKRLAGAVVERIGEQGGPADHGQALASVLPGLAEVGIAAVGHRVVHGGARFQAPTLIDDAVEAAIADLVPLAPLHNPANLAGIDAARELLPGLPHVAVFDTAFHATLPEAAWRYGLPADLADQHAVRRYGFHGPSHGWVAARAAEHLGTPLDRLRLITCHLGNGASVCAVLEGRSVDTSMGMTPVEGLVMGTRAGDVDVGALLHLARAEGLDLDGIDDLINRRSGLAGLSGRGNDLRDIEAGADAGDRRCQVAIDVFVHRLKKVIGAYAAVLGGVDAIVFTAGIGENSATVRHLVCEELEWLGARLDPRANAAAEVSDGAPVAEISHPHARCRLLIVATDEERAIAADAVRAIRDAAPAEARTIPVAISARHVHLTQEAVEQLFGPGHTLTPYRELSQPGQFACEERVNVIGPKRRIDGVRIIGPVRPGCQVEISRTDEFHLGVDAPIRASGHTKGSPGILLEGPAGQLRIEEGVIQAERHIHMTPDDAAWFGVEDRDMVEVAIDSPGRDLIFGDVLVRVSPRYRLEMHIDTDEGNAAEISSGHEGVLVATDASVRLIRRGHR